MAAERVRRWGVPPDTSVFTNAYGEVPCVSRQSMVEAILDGEAFLARSGGILEVIVSRHPTDLAGEAVTTGAVVSWKPGPRATVDERPRMTAVEAERLTESFDVESPAEGQPAPSVAQRDAAAVARDVMDTATAVVDRVGDGLDDVEYEEDDSEIPEGQR